MERLAKSHRETTGPIDPLSASLKEFESELVALDDIGITKLADALELSPQDAASMVNAYRRPKFIF